ncbi:MAG: acyl-CoA thioesterase [Calditrichaeota bacterium]|nr:acyl-CoA thioesterase [Calditrichota bacterium]
MEEFKTELKVRSYECDMYGHVNNAVYLQYCEFARVEFLEQLGFTLVKLKQSGILLPIVRIEIDYRKPLYSNEIIEVTVKWVKRGRSSAVFEQKIIKKATRQVAALAMVTWVSTDLKGKTKAIPSLLIESVQAQFGGVPEIEPNTRPAKQL